MDVSIILVNYNTQDLTRDCLKSIYEKTQGLDFDIWVVDNASIDNSVEMIKKEFPQVKLIESSENLGFGRANNLAIRQSNAKYCFLLNTDTILINNAVKILYDFMEKPKNATVGVCGGQLYDSEMNFQLSFSSFPTLAELFKRAFGLNFIGQLNRLKRKKITKNAIAEVESIIGADLMIRKEALNKTGLFDERFFMYLEETELLNRIRKNGYKNMFVPEAKIIHLEGASCKKEFKDKLIKEKLFKTSEFLFFKIVYGEKQAKIAKFLYQVYYFRYWLIRFFAPKFLKRLKMVSEINVNTL